MRAKLVLFPPMLVGILFDRFSLSARGSSASPLATRRPVLICFQPPGRHETRHELDDITATRMQNLPPSSCCRSDLGCCAMLCVSPRPAVVPTKDTRDNSTNAKQEIQTLPLCPRRGKHCCYCRTLICTICTIFSTAGSTQLTYTHVNLRAHTPVSPLPITDLRN